MTTIDCLHIYRESVKKSESFIAEAHLTKTDGSYIHGADFQSFVIASAVIHFSIAWESFLENIYSSFLMGEPDTQGRIVPCCVSVTNEEHAHRLLIGTNKYFDWTNPDMIIRLSQLYLQKDNPIKTAINALHSDLLDLKTIRNAAAHISSTTQQSLDALASRMFGHQIINASVEQVVNHIRNDGRTEWTFYKDLLDIAAENVAKGVV